MCDFLWEKKMSFNKIEMINLRVKMIWLCILAFKESNNCNHFFKSCINNIDRLSKSRVCLVGIMIYHIQKICDFSLTKDISTRICKNINQRRSDKIYFTKSLFYTWSLIKWWHRRSKIHSSDILVNLNIGNIIIFEVVIQN